LVEDKAWIGIIITLKPGINTIITYLRTNHDFDMGYFVVDHAFNM